MGERDLPTLGKVFSGEVSQGLERVKPLQLADLKGAGSTPPVRANVPVGPSHALHPADRHPQNTGVAQPVLVQGSPSTQQQRRQGASPPE